MVWKEARSYKPAGNNDLLVQLVNTWKYTVPKSVPLNPNLPQFHDGLDTK